MQIKIEVDGIIREYQGDYDELHNQDWNEKVRDMLDTVSNE